MPKVLIYRDTLLGKSQTFILSQVEKYKKYQVVFMGSKKIRDSLDINYPTQVINSGGLSGLIKEIFFKMFGIIFIKKSEELAIIHAHIGLDAVMAGTLSRKWNVPLVVTFHGKDSTISSRNFNFFSFRHINYLLFKKKVDKRVSVFLAVSDYIKRELIDRGFSKEKIKVHYIGVNLKKFTPSAIHREKVILFAGRLVEKKGITYLIDAMEIVERIHPDYKLVILGDGPLIESLKEKASAKLKNYEFLGFLSHSEIRKWMNKASIFASPSVTAKNGDIEGLPTTLVEASAMELPIVATYHSGIPEIIKHRKTGLLTEERNVEELANNIVELIESESLRVELASNARKFVLNNFDIDMQTAKLEQVYNQLMQ